VPTHGTLITYQHIDNTICKSTLTYILNLQAPLQGLGGCKHTTRGNFGKKMYSNFSIFVFFWKQIFFHFIQCFKKHLKWILDIRLITQSCYLSKESFFIHFFFIHLCSFKWKTSSICFLWNHMSGTFHMELKWYN